MGISTHSVKVVEKSSEIKEIDVVFPLINAKGLGIIDGNAEDMQAAIHKCNQAGKGLYAMKVLAGGNMLTNIQKQINSALEVPGISSAAIGVTSIDELKYNLSLLNVPGLKTEELPDTTKTKQLFLLTSNCTGCGTCVATCPNYALSLQDNVAVVDHNNCILCGYCSPVCPQFTIRII